MKVLDRHVFRLFLLGGLVGGGACLGLAIVVDAVDRIDDFLKHEEGRRLTMVLRYYGLRMPEFLHHLLPLTALMGGLAATAHLVRRRELVGLMAAGVSSRRTVLVLAVGGVLAGGAIAANQEILMPATARVLHDEEERLLNKEWEEEFFYGPPVTADTAGRLFQAQRYDPRAHTLLDVTVLEPLPGGGQRVWTADRLRETPPGRWALEGGVTRAWPGGDLLAPPAERLPDGTEIETDLSHRRIARKELPPLFLTTRELLAESREHPGLPRLRILLWNRVATVFLPVVLVVLGAGLMLGAGRGRLLRGAASAMGIAFALYIVQSFCVSIAGQGVFPPAPAALLPLAAAALAAARLMRRVPT